MMMLFGSTAAPKRALTCWLVGGLLFSAAQLEAQAPHKLAGSYTASPQHIEVQIATWGEDCGTRPKSQVINEAGNVTVKEDGAHLVMRFADRTLRSNGCWSPNQSVKLTGSGSANGRFSAQCSTPQGDAKREVGRYTVTVSPGRLELAEESQYDWQLKASHCEAKVRMTQTLTSIAHPPPAPPAPAAVVRPPSPVEPARETACVPGAPVRLRLRPSDARITPGERVCFTARAFDAANCAVNLPENAPTLSLVRPVGVEGALSGSCFKAAANAALAEGIFKLVASHAGLRAEATVVVSAPDLSDITARRGAQGGGSLGASEAGQETALESGVRAVATGSHGMLWLGLGIATLASLLSLVAILALRVLRKQGQAEPLPFPRTSLEWPEEAPLAEASSAPRPGQVARAAPAPVIPSGPQRICPRCRRGYPPGSERCESDSEQLLDYADFVKLSEAKAPARHCPECGEQLAAESVFCGRCGHALGG